VRGIGRTLRARIPEGTTVEVVASDLLRTRQTAAVVADALASTVRLDRRLREKSYGTAEGREQAYLDARFVPPPPTGDRLRHDEGVTGSETRLDLGRRVYAATTELLGHEAEHQVVITHGFAATFVVAAWIGMPLEASGHVAFHVRSGSISVLREDAFFHNRSVVSVGETSHLAQP
jgi:probable phosphoglycerate mutase